MSQLQETCLIKFCMRFIIYEGVCWDKHALGVRYFVILDVLMGKNSVAYSKMMWYVFNNSIFLFFDRILTIQCLRCGADYIVRTYSNLIFLHQFLDLMLLKFSTIL